MKTLKRLKQQINCNCQTPYCSVATSVATASDLRFTNPPPYSLVLALSDFWLSELSRNIPKEIVSHVIKKFKMLQQNDIDNSLKILQ
jgi:hypothetical protein